MKNPLELTVDLETLINRRTIIPQYKIRAAGGEPEKLAGRAIVYGAVSEIFPGYFETIEIGAFADSLSASPDVRALWQHDPAYVLGRTKAGTLAIDDNDQGLDFEITPPATAWALDAVETIRRGDVDQMSFGWLPEDGGITWEPIPGQPDAVLARVNRAILYELSPVTFPAYPQTTITLRQQAEQARARLAGLDPIQQTDHARARLVLMRHRLHLLELEQVTHENTV